MAGGDPMAIAGLRPDEVILGWTNDDQVYVGTGNINRAAYHIDKLNPFTGVRTASRDLYGIPYSGIAPDAPILTPDGATFAFDYRLRLSDLYVVSGVR